jgi:hypothetical protein
MNRAESIINRIGEECCETAQRVSKALLFGLDEIQPGQPYNNAERLIHELHDIVGVAMMAHREGLIPNPIPDEATVEAKRVRVEKYIELQRSMGRLTEN